MKKEANKIIYLSLIGLTAACTGSQKEQENKQPNFLFCIADDMSWQHASIMGYNQVSTPGFDSVAKSGILFQNGYCNAPSCSASRAAILTGRNAYELEEGGCLWGILPSKFTSYQDILEDNGYFVGYTGKGWGPGDIEDAGRIRNPAGPKFNSIQNHPFKEYGVQREISHTDYAENFKDFLSKKPDDKPFSFWYSAFEPHRSYLDGIGEKSGKNLDSIVVPDFLPDTRKVRSDIADYLFEIEWYDEHIVRMLKILEENGELDNTIIIVTSDNGMPFPRAKANLYEYGTHMPLAVCWGNKIKPNRVVKDMVSLIDFAPTFIEAAGIEIPENMSGKSLMKVFESDKSGQVDPKRDIVVTMKERHAMSYANRKCYSQRAIRKGNYLLVWNLFPEMWPAGNEDPEYNWEYAPFGDIDGGPSKDEVLINDKYKELATDKRPEYELFDIEKDPFQLNNIAETDVITLEELKSDLEEYLNSTGDPRMKNKNTDVFENAVYYGPLWKETAGMLLKPFLKLSKEEQENRKEEYIKEVVSR